MKDTILVILYKRPEYTRQVLAALAAQPEISQMHVHFQIDSCIKEVVIQALDFNATSKTININGTNVGCTANLYTGLSVAFSISEFVIVVEDDCLPAKDFLKYMLWAKPRINDDTRTISAYHKYEACPVDRYNVVHHMNHWCAWSWATTRKHWEKAKLLWDWNTELSWDLMIANNYFWQGKTVMPYLSRCKNIGALNGTYVVSEEQHTEHVLIHHWADSVDEKLLGDFEFKIQTDKDELPLWENHPLKHTLILKHD